MKSLISAFLLLLSFHLSGQLEVKWSNLIGGSSFESSSGIFQTDDDKILLLGWSNSKDLMLSENLGLSDIILIQTNELGDIDWIKNYGGSRRDVAADIIKSDEGGYLIIGGTESNDNQIALNRGSSDVWVVKISDVGELVWELTLGDTLWDDAKDVVQDQDGNYVILSRTQKVSTLDDFLITKIDQQGNVIWNNVYGGSENDLPSIILETENGYFIMGSSRSADMSVSDNNGELDYWILKIDLNGNQLWNKNYGSEGSEILNSAIKTSDGNLIIIGRVLQLDPSLDNGKFLMTKLNTDGDLVWEKVFGGSEIDNPTQVGELLNGNFIVVGYSSSSDGDLTLNNGNNDFWILQISKDGNIINTKSFGGSDSDRLTQMTLHEDRILVAGHSYSNDLEIASNQGFSDIWYGEIGTSTFTYDHHSVAKLNLFPNPVHHTLSVNLPNNEKLLSVKLFNLDGRVVITEESSLIDVSNLSSGVYIVHVESDQAKYYQKAVARGGR